MNRIKNITGKAVWMALACALVLSACGGGGGGDDPAPSTTNAAPTLKPVAVYLDGDSLLWGAAVSPQGTTVQSPSAPPIILQADLQNALGSTVTVINGAVPSTNLSTSLNGTAPFYTQPLSVRLAETSAQLVLTDYGINDATKFTVDQYVQNLNTWIATVRAAGKTPILEEPNPSCHSGEESLDQFVAAMDQIAQQQNIPIIQQYAYIKSLPNWQSMLIDCVHPGADLYKIKAQREFEALEPIMSTLQR